MLEDEYGARVCGLNRQVLPDESVPKRGGVAGKALWVSYLDSDPALNFMPEQSRLKRRPVIIAVWREHGWTVNTQFP